MRPSKLSEHSHLIVRCSLFVVFLTILCSIPAHGQTTIMVAPTQLWTDTGVSVSVGETINLAASGQLDWQSSGCSWPNSNNCTSDPDGPGPSVCNSTNNPNPPPYTSLPCNSLIGVISANGPTNGTAFEVGTTLTSLTASVAGELFLGVNDGYLPDNSQGWSAVITITAAPPPTCSQLYTVDPSAIQVNAINFGTSSIQDFGGKPYLVVSTGNKYQPSPFQHGIEIQAWPALALAVNAPYFPVLTYVSNEVDWSGFATYGSGKDRSEELHAALSGGAQFPLYDVSQFDQAVSPFYWFDDSPDVWIPLTDQSGKRLSEIGYSKSFKTVVACHKSDEQDRHALAVINWTANYSGPVDWSKPKAPKLEADGGVIYTIDAPSSTTDFIYGGPTGNCYVSYVGFAGTIYPPRNGCPTTAPPPQYAY